jgi:SAM-dependent methyltransferase
LSKFAILKTRSKEHFEMNSEILNSILACSVCGANLRIADNDNRVHCIFCGARFNKGNYVWNFIPTNIDWSSPMWNTWQHLQENGLASYQFDPEHNLAVVERDDITGFAQFCNCRGLVLDVGCGPQAWPSYFERGRSTVYVGIDPLIDDTPGEYFRIKGLGEFLPFRSKTFDHLLFSTTLDHFIDPIAALKAAARVCKSEGEIDIWLGEKHPDAPRPAVSPEWYLRLQKPQLAQDLFHVKRLTKSEFIEIVETAGLIIAETETHVVDQYRANHFYRLRIGY